METIIRAKQTFKTPIATFRTVSIYENLPAGQSAKQFHDRLSHQFRRDFTFSHTMWNFAVLGLSEARTEALESLNLADLIVLSVDQAKSSLTEIPKWNNILDILLELSAENKPALATIYHRGGDMEFTDAAHTKLSRFYPKVRNPRASDMGSVYA